MERQRLSYPALNTLNFAVYGINYVTLKDLEHDGIKIPKGYVFDGVTVKAPFTLLFSTKDLRQGIRASCFHDWICQNKKNYTREYSTKVLVDIWKQDGFIRLELVDDTDTPLTDNNGQPMAAQIDYKAGDTIKPELYIGEFQAKAFTNVHLRIELGFPNDEVIPVGANTQICLQAISKDESSGLALLSFMAFTGFRIGFDTVYYGFNSLNLGEVFSL